MVQPAPVCTTRHFTLPASFQEWRAHLTAEGVAPVIAVAGSRGKTTVARLLDAMYQATGLRTAIWTDRGVEINGRLQRGELVPWSRVFERLREGSLDVAIQELDWDTVHAVGLPTAGYPIVAVTNLCVNSDSCLIQEEAMRARRALGRIRGAVRSDGSLIINGEDFAVAAGHDESTIATLLVGVTRDTPLVRAHLRAGHSAAWTEQSKLLLGSSTHPVMIGAVNPLPLALDGRIGFQTHNALMAGSIAQASGIEAATISGVLRAFRPPVRLMPGSFNVVSVNGATAIVDRPAPPWFLRPCLRAISHLPARRLLTVVGQLASVPDDELAETGRLIGRGGGALMLHGAEVDQHRAESFLRGVSSNDVPPLVIHVGTERQAITRALGMLRQDDLMVVFADQPASVLRALGRAAALPEVPDHGLAATTNW